MVTRGSRDALAEAIVRVLESPNELDQNLEAANVVDALCQHARAMHRVAEGLQALAAAIRSQRVDG